MSQKIAEVSVLAGTGWYVANSDDESTYRLMITLEAGGTAVQIIPRDWDIPSSILLLTNRNCMRLST